MIDSYFIDQPSRISNDDSIVDLATGYAKIFGKLPTSMIGHELRDNINRFMGDPLRKVYTPRV